MRTYAATPVTRTCFVPRCAHRHDDGWTHVTQPRRTPPVAHLRLVGRAA